MLFLGSSASHAAVPSLPRSPLSEYGQCVQGDAIVQGVGKGCYSPAGQVGCYSPGGR